MVKKLFIYISMGILTLFLLWYVHERSAQTLYSSVDSVLVVKTPDNVDREKLNATLTRLANENNSVIARRIAQPHPSGKAHFTYQKYGDGELPPYFVEASEESAQMSGLANGYLIVKGNLPLSALVNTLEQLGYTGSQSKADIPALVLFRGMSSGTYLVMFIVMLLTYMALTLITQIKSLRFVSIRLIAGEKLTTIIYKSILNDITILLLATVIFGSIGSVILFSMQLGYMPLLVVLWQGLLGYAGVLLGLSIVLGTFYLIGFKKTQLVQLLKGRLPVKKMITFLLVTQLLAVIVVGWSLGKVIPYFNEYATMQQASKQWDTINKVNLSFNIRNMDIDKATEEKTWLQWHELLTEALQHNQMVLVKHNLADQKLSNVGPGEHISSNAYHPNGNTIYVTPNYFDEQGITLDKTVKNELEQLKEHEIGLLLPETLKNEASTYQKLYEDYFEKYFGDSETNEKVKITAKVNNMPVDTRYFIYNQTPIASQQYVKDPIIVVVTPTSTGKLFGALTFWQNNLRQYVFFNNFKDTEQLLRKHQLYLSISYIKNSRALYYEQLENYRNATVQLIVGSVLGIVTSILLFNTMNLLYFEQFRRDIFIKRIAGMPFLTLHQDYIMAQGIVMLIGFSASVFLTKTIWTSVVTLVVFAINSVGLLYIQLKKENKMALTILKGK